MPDLFDLISKWWKQMVIIVFVSTIITAVITFLKPHQYLSVATAVPASSFSADKAKIFNQNIEALYTALGTADDLDMILGTAKLDTVYLFITDQFNLYDHYKMSEKGNAARIKAALLLKGNTRVIKSEYGELKVKVWDTDKNLAPQLANAIMSRLEFTHRELQGAGNKSVLSALDSSLKKNENSEIKSEELIDQYRRLKSEYQLMVDNKPPVLIVVENAKPAEWPDKPKIFQTVIATAALSLLFSVLVALLLDKRKSQKK